MDKGRFPKYASMSSSKDALEKEKSFELKNMEHSLGYVFASVTLWLFFPEFLHKESSVVEVCVWLKQEESLHLCGNRALRHQRRRSNSIAHMILTVRTEAGK